MNVAMAVFVKLYVTAMITALQIKYVTIACAILDVAAIIHVQVMNLVSVINAEVSV